MYDMSTLLRGIEMERRNLFICETPFQVLVSLLYIYDSCAENVNDFIIVDTMSDYVGIADRLNNHPLIDYAFAARTKDLWGNNGRLLDREIKNSFPVFTRLWSYRKIQEKYEYIYCRNYTTPITEAAFRHFRKLNSDLEIHIIDEGYSSYLSSFWNSHNSISIFHKFSNFLLSGRRDFLYRNITEALFFAPELLHVQLPFPIKRIVKEDFKICVDQLRDINAIFNYDRSENVKDGQFIFFEECFSFDDGNNNDLEIVELISTIVGKENLKIKLHPRSKTDRFSTLGYEVMKSAKYPWEVYALNNADKRITLLAYSSGALMNYLFLSRSNMKSIMLYNAIPNKYNHMTDSEVLLWFKEFQNIYSSWVYSPDSKTMLEDIIKSESSIH